MLITSLSFAGFTALVGIIYYLIPARWQNAVLLLASYAFLGIWAVEFMGVFAALTLVNYGLAGQVLPDKAHRVAYLRVGIVVNVAALAFFKYHGFFLDRLNLSALDSLRILLPIGLSFFILQAISYLMDIEKGLLEPEKNLPDFALYLVYFPKVTSGPIERARDFLPKLKEPRSWRTIPIGESFTLILLGLFRKLAVADVLLIMLPADLFKDPRQFEPPALLLWLLVYACLLYNDFAGYTSLVRGVSLIFGIRLSLNFNTPYLARNMVEFWQRWHISLSEWLRDYIFTPFTRGLLRRKYNSRHLLTIIIPPMVTMFISALWHDVSWNMLLWGGLHGVYQVVERLRAIYYPSQPPQNHPLWRQVGGMLVVFILVMLAWVPFRADLTHTQAYWGGLLDWQGWQASTFELGYYLHIIALSLIGVSLLLDLVHYRYGELIYMELPPFVQAILINLVIFGVIWGLSAQGDVPPPFIYQGF